MDLDNTISDIFFHMVFARAGHSMPSNSQVEKYAGQFAAILRDASVGDKYNAKWLREDFQGRV